MNNDTVMKRVAINGIDTSISNNLYCIEDSNSQTVICYVAGNFVVLQNETTNKQEFLHGSGAKYGEVSAIAKCSNKKYLVLACNPIENESYPSVLIYNYEAMRQIRKLSMDNPKSILSSIAISTNGINIIALAKSPNSTWNLSIWNIVNGNEKMHIHLDEHDGVTKLKISFHPTDDFVFYISEERQHKIYKVYENLKIEPTPASSSDSLLFDNDLILDCCWLVGPFDYTLLAMDSGRILLCENSSLRFSAFQADLNPVQSIAPMTKGFLVAFETNIHFFQYKSEIKRETFCDMFECKARYSIKSSLPFSSKGISMIAIPNHEKKIYMIADEDQLYSINIDDEKQRNRPESVVFCNGHHGTIIGFDTCISKPLIITAGTDRSIRLCDYVKGNKETLKKFHEEIFSVALHPSGHHALAGFSDKLRLMNVLVNDLRIIWEIPVKACKLCHFCTGGHLFSVVQGSTIFIYDFILKIKKFELKGHNSRIFQLEWNIDDSFIVSCDEDGTIYSWDIHSGQRVGEFSKKASCKRCFEFINDNELWVLDDDNITELLLPDLKMKQKINNEIMGDYIGPVITSKSGDRSIFIVNDKNVIHLHHLDIPGRRKCTIDIRMQASLFKVSCDSRFLIALDKNRKTIHTFEIQDKRLRAQSLMTLVHDEYKPHSLGWNDDVLISENDLEERTALIHDLKNKINEARSQYEYQLRLNAMANGEELKKVKNLHSSQIQAEETKLQSIQKEKNEIHAKHAILLNQYKEEFQSNIQCLDINYRKELLAAVDVYQAQMKNIDLEQKQKISEKETLELTHEKNFKQIEAELLEKLQLSTQKYNKIEHDYNEKCKEDEIIKRQTEDEIDEEVENLKSKHENELDSQRNTTIRFTGDNGILKKKICVIRKEIENRKEVVHSLLEQEEETREQIKEYENKIASQVVEMKTRENKIKSKNVSILNLRTKNKELGKYKHVLEYDLTELMKQIEPRKKELSDITKQMAALKINLKKNNETNLELNKIIIKQKDSFLTAQNTIATLRKKIKYCESRTFHVIKELNKCTELIQSPALLAEQIDVMKKFLIHNIEEQKKDAMIVSHDSASSKKIQLEEIQKEYKELSKKNAKDLKNIKEKNTSLRVTNEEMMKEIDFLKLICAKKKEMLDKKRFQQEEKFNIDRSISKD